MQTQTEYHDNYVYQNISFYRHTVVFLFEAIKFYESLLQNEANFLKENEHLSNFLTNELRKEFRVGSDLQKATRLKAWLHNHLNENTDEWDIVTSLSHGNIRLLKSAGILYLGFLKQQRNELSKNPNCSNNLLAALDRGITTEEEMLNNMGVFKNASIISLTIDQSFDSAINKTPESPTQPSLSKIERPRPQIIRSIEILDNELRRRCLDLFNQFEEFGDTDRYDTVVTEATRVLEDRLRRITRTTDGSTALKLVTRAFEGEKPILAVSQVPSEQEGAQHLFRGLFGYIRNQVHHKLVHDIQPERVIQILGLVDYLLTIINTASPIENEEK